MSIIYDTSQLSRGSLTLPLGFKDEWDAPVGQVSGQFTLLRSGCIEGFDRTGSFEDLFRATEPIFHANFLPFHFDGTSLLWQYILAHYDHRYRKCSGAGIGGFPFQATLAVYGCPRRRC